MSTTYLSVTQCPRTSRYDAHFEQRIGMLQKPSTYGMSGFMVRHSLLLLSTQYPALPLQPNDNALDCGIEVHRLNVLRSLPSRMQSRLVTDVGDVRTREARRKNGKLLG